jgi:hypothetical protein
VLRRLLNLVTVLSLLLFVAVVVLWVRSRFRWDRIAWGPEGPVEAATESGTCHAVSSVTGHLVYSRLTWQVETAAEGPTDEGESVEAEETADEETDDVGAGRSFESRPIEPGRHFLYLAAAHALGDSGREFGLFSVGTSDFGFQEAAEIARFRRLSVTVPYWAVGSFGALLPFARLASLYKRSIRRRRARGGLCPRCGYDLRASPGRCPECGSAREEPEP